METIHFALIATIHERGNGWPVAGDYVPSGSGQLYRVVRMGGHIEAPNPLVHNGASLYVPGCEVEPADWSDCADGDEFRAEVVID